MPDGTPNAAETTPIVEAPVPGQAPAAGSAQQEPQQVETPNLEEQRIRQIAQEEATRIAQSQVAKGENRINARIQQQLQALEQTKGVLKLTDDQVAEARKNIVTDAFTSEPEQPATDQQPEPELHPLAQVAFPIFDEVGVRVEDGDPEFNTLKPYLMDPAPTPAKLAKFVQATYAAAAAKNERLASNKEKASLRVPGGGAGAAPGEAPANSAADYWNKAYPK